MSKLKIEGAEGGVMKASRRVPGEAVQSFEEAISTLSPVANPLISKIINTANPPDKANVEFGLTLKGDYGIIITKVGAEANFKVSLKQMQEKPKG
jgi:hypothetical protein